jgi:hypothetical protein
MINLKDDFAFYHKSGSTAVGVREVRDEYLRLGIHELQKLEKRAARFFLYRRDHDDNERSIFAISHNVQSLHAQKEDVETDDVLTRADYLVLNETRMDSDDVVSLQNYELVQHKKREPGRTAGGVAIYRHVDCLTNAVAIPHLPNIEKVVRVETGVGDICLVSVSRGDRLMCHLGSAYVDPNVPFSKVKFLFLFALAQYATWILEFIPELDVDLDVLIALLGIGSRKGRHCTG